MWDGRDKRTKHTSGCDATNNHHNLPHIQFSGGERGTIQEHQQQVTRLDGGDLLLALLLLLLVGAVAGEVTGLRATEAVAVGLLRAAGGNVALLAAVEARLRSALAAASTGSHGRTAALATLTTTLHLLLVVLALGSALPRPVAGRAALEAVAAVLLRAARSLRRRVVVAALLCAIASQMAGLLASVAASLAASRSSSRRTAISLRRALSGKMSGTSTGVASSLRHCICF